MSTFNYSNGNLAGLQMQGGSQVGVNFFEVDFAEVFAAHPTLAVGDLILAGLLPAGALVTAVSVETLEASQVGATDLVIQDDGAVIIVAAHGIDTLGEITGPTAGAATFFGGGTATGLHTVFLTTEKQLHIKVGATVPTKGKIRLAAALSHMAKF